MPVVKEIDYLPPNRLLRNGHVNTIFSFLLRKRREMPYVRERQKTPDNDFFDVDFIRNGNNRLAILSHGLEGSSDSQYMQWTATLLSASDWDVAAMNHRSCSGELNKKPQTYHSGFTKDVYQFSHSMAEIYDQIVLIGFSLGGNVVIKYSSDQVYPVPPEVKAVVAVSTPCDLLSASKKLLQRSNYIYVNRFLISLKEKIRRKHYLFPDDIDLRDVKKIKNLWDFDEYYTAPVNGFLSPEDYYTRCSSRPHLPNITIPTLLINAIDDPFLDNLCFPYEEAEANENFFLMTPRYGGHVGFFSGNNKFYWEEREILRFIEDPYCYY